MGYNIIPVAPCGRGWLKPFRGGGSILGHLPQHVCSPFALLSVSKSVRCGQLINVYGKDWPGIMDMLGGPEMTGEKGDSITTAAGTDKAEVDRCSSCSSVVYVASKSRRP